MSTPTLWVDATVTVLAPLAGTRDADAMRAYMKGVAPFLGIPTPARRSAQRAAWAHLPVLAEAEVAAVSRALWALPEREYQYAACDVIGRHSHALTGGFVHDPVQALLTTKPWWDTVDSLGSVAVTPLVDRYPELVDLMWAWLDSGDRWLVRAALQHQRGLKERTDVGRLVAMCDRFATDREFFIAKAIGWALRDTARWDPSAVRLFVDQHPDLSAVARREALRGLAAR